jgi:hypothetical protein
MAAKAATSTLETITGTVVFTDIVGFTAFTEEAGDEQAMAVLTAQETVVSGLLPSGARIVKELGDGMMLWFPDAAAAISTAVLLQTHLDGEDLAEGFPLWLRIGAHTGTQTRRRDDLVGHDVNVATYWVETLGCPKNQVDSDKLVGTLVADGWSRPTTRVRPTWSWSTRARSSRRPARSRSTRCWPLSDVRRRGAPSWSSPGAWPSATATSWPAPYPRSTRWPGSVCRSASGTKRPSVPVVRPAQPAPSAGHRAVGLREGGRGLRPGLRVLRHPELPGAAAVAVHRLDPGRGRRARRGRDRAGRPGPGQRSAATRVSASAPSCRWSSGGRPGRPGPPALPVPVRPHRRLVDAICATGVPYFDLSLQHVSRPLLRRMRRWGDGERSSTASPTSVPVSPTRRSGRTSSSGIPARPRPTTTRSCGSSSRPSSTGAGSSPTRPRRAPTPPTSTARSRRPRGRAPGRAARCRTHHRGAAHDLIGTTIEVLVDEPGVARSIVRRPRSTASSPCPTRSTLARSTGWSSPTRSVPTSSLRRRSTPW